MAIIIHENAFIPDSSHQVLPNDRWFLPERYYTNTVDYTFDYTKKSSLKADMLYVAGMLLVILPIMVLYTPPKTTSLQWAIMAVCGVNGMLLSLASYLRSKEIRDEIKREEDRENVRWKAQLRETYSVKREMLCLPPMTMTAKS